MFCFGKKQSLNKVKWLLFFLRNLACYGKVYVAARQFILGIRICSKSYKQMDDRQENEVQAKQRT